MAGTAGTAGTKRSGTTSGTRTMLIGYAAIGAGAASMIGLHVATGLDPLHTVISEYAFEPDGWLLPTSLTLFAVGATAFAVLLARRGEDRKAALLVGVWGLCMLLVGAFPTDRPGVPLSMSGGIHRYAAFAAFLAMPVAGLILARRHEGRPYARAVKAFSLVSMGVLVLVVVPYAVRMLGVEPVGVPAGAIQRLVVVSEVVVLAMLGLVLGSGPVRGGAAFGGRERLRGQRRPRIGGAAGAAGAHGDAVADARLDRLPVDDPRRCFS
ncbi:DUF998 domain-containing protein [Planomonospora sp. ID82291]|uniref:DUF998 domain-containing protein n=1 Tax=Planomonospora sp. ID82291 TaxID=2738136 RepID=UPI0018C44A7B|nr:DUF998 domain-containing protein [Planomonospora sp. ID82291]MBG0815653.1 DUF998 domain-containing protein [Planomonospora sp. ID82291]